MIHIGPPPSTIHYILLVIRWLDIALPWIKVTINKVIEDQNRRREQNLHISLEMKLKIIIVDVIINNYLILV